MKEKILIDKIKKLIEKYEADVEREAKMMGAKKPNADCTTCKNYENCFEGINAVVSTTPCEDYIHKN